MKFILQRKIEGDAGKWRSITWFVERDQEDITQIARLLNKIGLIGLRIVMDVPTQDQVARWDFTKGDWV